MIAAALRQRRRARRELRGHRAPAGPAASAGGSACDRPVYVVHHPDRVGRGRARCRASPAVYNRSDVTPSFPRGRSATLVRSLEEALLQRVRRGALREPRPDGRRAGPVGGSAFFLDHGVDLEHFAPRGRAEEPADLARHPAAAHRVLRRPRRLRRRLRPARGASRGRCPDAHARADRRRHLLDGPLRRAIPTCTGSGTGPTTEIPRVRQRASTSRSCRGSTTSGSEHCNPIKLKEYLALGLPVVSTDFPEVRHYARRRSASAGTTTSFVDHVAQALLDRTSGAARRQASRRCAWHQRALDLVASCAEPADRAGPRLPLMCGIVGIRRFDGAPGRSRAVLRRMMDRACAHRGPDDEGVWTEGSIGLGHRASLDHRRRAARRSRWRPSTGELAPRVQRRDLQLPELRPQLRLPVPHRRATPRCSWPRSQAYGPTPRAAAARASSPSRLYDRADGRPVAGPRPHGRPAALLLRRRPTASCFASEVKALLAVAAEATAQVDEREPRRLPRAPVGARAPHARSRGSASSRRATCCRVGADGHRLTVRRTGELPERAGRTVERRTTAVERGRRRPDGRRRRGPRRRRPGRRVPQRRRRQQPDRRAHAAARAARGARVADLRRRLRRPALRRARPTRERVSRAVRHRPPRGDRDRPTTSRTLWPR